MDQDATPFDVEQLEISDLYDLAEDAHYAMQEVAMLRDWLFHAKMLLEVAVPHVEEPKSRT